MTHDGVLEKDTHVAGKQETVNAILKIPEKGENPLSANNLVLAQWPPHNVTFIFSICIYQSVLLSFQKKCQH